MYPSRYKNTHKVKRFARRQSEYHQRLVCTSPGVPCAPEAVNQLMKGKLPMTNRIGNLILDEHEFLEIEELREKQQEALEKLEVNELEFATAILSGKNATRAYLDAGFLANSKRTEKGKLEKARFDAAEYRKRPNVAQYISATLQLKYKESMAEVKFNQLQWLQMQRELLDMALGRVTTPKTYVMNGEIIQEDVKDASLTVAARTLEVIAKHYGWLTEKMEMTGEGPVVTLKDFTGMAKQLASQSTDDDQDSTD